MQIHVGVFKAIRRMADRQRVGPYPSPIKNTTFIPTTKNIQFKHTSQGVGWGIVN